MTILQITNRFPPFARGGAEQVALAIEKGGSESGNRVVTVSTRPRETMLPKRPDTYYLPSDLYDFDRLSRSTRLLLHLRSVFGSSVAAMVRPILIREKPQLVITHNLIGLDFAIPGMIAGLGIPHIHILHDIQLLHPSGLMYRGGEGIIKTPWAEIYQYFVRQKFLPTDMVVSPSTWLLDLHRSRGLFSKVKCRVIRNPLMTDIGRGASLTREKVFLFVGQLEPHKGVLTLIRAYERYLVAETDPWRLVIVGNGSLQNTVTAFAAGHAGQVVHIPYSPETESDWLSRSGALVVPSLCYENSPTVIYRAAAAGLTVLAADIGGIRELTDEIHGRSFPTGDEVALAVALSQIQKNPGSSGVESIVLGPSAKDYVSGLLAFAGAVI